MKEAVERTIYDNYYSDGRFEAARENLWEDYRCDYVLEDYILKSPDDIPDNEIFNEMDFMDYIEWGELVKDFNDFLENRTLVCTGSVGLWTGQHEGGTIIEDFEDMRKLWNDCDYVHIYDKNGHLYIKCSHHDGINYYELRELTQKGLDLYERHNLWGDEWTDRRLHKTLFKKPYSVLPNYAHIVYGCKKREYEKVA